VERQNGLAPGPQGTQKAQAKKAGREIAADVEMGDIVVELRKKPHYLERVLRIADLIAVGLAVPGEVNDGTGNLPSEKQTVDGHQIRLHAAVRRRIRPEKEYSHRLRN
jgi:hypothetical protein